MTEITISGDSLIIKELTEIVNSNKSLRYEKLELLNKIEDLEKEIIKLKQPRQISYDRYISPYGETYQMLLNLDKYIQEIYGHSLFHCSYGGAEVDIIKVNGCGFQAYSRVVEALKQSGLDFNGGTVYGPTTLYEFDKIKIGLGLSAR